MAAVYMVLNLQEGCVKILFLQIFYFFSIWGAKKCKGSANIVQDRCKGSAKRGKKVQKVATQNLKFVWYTQRVKVYKKAN